ncbi:hypothetical protein [Dyella sp. GSA-30]|uniref:hypothetical protein n=1 Tax=Dyella sp. GSA-30 TaxID=2994496 RepID=UPI0024912A06|nr:hypothetical protein [Dyella sp. GSA-30]BDU19392.1 hypothetical protein DYGSA30_08490 [Dyella sp. GSA-30]
MKLLREILLRLHVAGPRLLGVRRARSQAVLKVTVPQPLSEVAIAPIAQISHTHSKPLPYAVSTDDRRQAA